MCISRMLRLLRSSLHVTAVGVLTLKGIFDCASLKRNRELDQKPWPGPSTVCVTVQASHILNDGASIDPMTASEESTNEQGVCCRCTLLPLRSFADDSGLINEVPVVEIAQGPR